MSRAIRYLKSESLHRSLQLVDLIADRLLKLLQVDARAKLDAVGESRSVSIIVNHDPALASKLYFEGDFEGRLMGRTAAGKGLGRGSRTRGLEDWLKQ